MRAALRVVFSLLTAFALAAPPACGGAIEGADRMDEPDDGPVDGSADAGRKDASTDAAADSKDGTCGPATKAGDACAEDGAYCSPSPCTDECNYCHALYCGQGAWQEMEAFPMPQSYCASAPCGSLTCGKGEFCVRTSGGPQGAEPTYACAKLPSGCVDCTCATESACPGMTKTCTPDPDTTKPIVDCSAA